MSFDVLLRNAVHEAVEPLREEVRQLREDLRTMREMMPPPKRPSLSDRLLTVSEAAKFCGFTVATLREWINANRLSAIRAGRHWRIRKSALEAFVSSAAHSASPAPKVDEQVERILSGLEPSANDHSETSTPRTVAATKLRRGGSHG